MNLLDLMIVVGLVAVFGAVFFAGFGRALAFLAALWVGLVAADTFGGPIGRMLHNQIPGIERWTADVIGFLLTFVVFTAVFVYLALRSFRTFSSRTGYDFESRGGIPLLLATIVLAGVVALATVTVLVQVTSRTVDDLPPGETPGFLMRQHENAALRPATDRIATYVYNATGSWAPGGAPSLLSPED